jgi:hypothetical protein
MAIVPTGFQLPPWHIGEWLGLAATMGFIVSAGIVGVRRRGAWRAVLLGCAAIAFLRIVLIGNPLAWQYYASRLSADTVGWRQYDLVRVERDRFVPPRGARYLAVGSSQTDAIYNEFARTNADVETYVVAAMTPMDFVLHAREIARRRPETVLLYLSEFDMAKRLAPEAIVVAPRLRERVLPVARRLLSRQDRPELGSAVVELAFGELFPEFRYRFVFRGLVDRQFKRIARRVGVHHDLKGARAAEAERIHWFRQSLDAQEVTFQEAWLVDFLLEMNREGIEVVIVEGDYNPSAEDARLAALHGVVRSRFEDIAVEMKGVRFVRQAELYAFTSADYPDLTHVTPEAGARFARSLLELLEAQSTQR